MPGTYFQSAALKQKIRRRKKARQPGSCWNRLRAWLHPYDNTASPYCF
ncbi:hypothetical protein KNP414_05673 [Paenibacillus mucilaginosus KNP414]|uniref:Uncharacterized protein n=1 Tax=Paenibacillus mucilaginosus (strain KNP414) TaxID=1036673 RepID=F8FMM6_PAEMK|nr:hypothetical protein KNP414_05673 [Paenibacillus mucilaginosus KNP414]